MQIVVPTCGVQERKHLFFDRDFSQWSAYWCQEGREWKTKNLLWKIGILFPKRRHENRNQHRDNHPELWFFYISLVLVWYSSSWESEASIIPCWFPCALGTWLQKPAQAQHQQRTVINLNTRKSRLGEVVLIYCYPHARNCFQSSLCLSDKATVHGIQ